jgi:lysophospholipase L1-like esterase
MKLAFIGDSITEGVGASSTETCYVSRVGQILGCTVLNYGIAATRIARQTAISAKHIADMDFNLRLDMVDLTADRVFVFGGTNDYGHGDAKIGNAEDTDCHTFHGAVKTLFTTLIKRFSKDKVVVLLPLKRSEMDEKENPTTGKKLVDYVEIIKRYVDLYGLKYIDLFSALPKPPAGESEFFADGLHPNDKGSLFIAEKICEFIKNDK